MYIRALHIIYITVLKLLSKLSSVKFLYRRLSSFTSLKNNLRSF